MPVAIIGTTWSSDFTISIYERCGDGGGESPSGIGKNAQCLVCLCQQPPKSGADSLSVCTIMKARNPSDEVDVTLINLFMSQMIAWIFARHLNCYQARPCSC